MAFSRSRIALLVLALLSVALIAGACSCLLYTSDAADDLVSV